MALDLVLSADANKQPRAYAGGTCGNVLTILQYLGWEAFPVARIGNDAAARYLIRDLEVWGVSKALLAIEADVNTPIIVQQISRNKRGDVQHRFSWQCPSCGRYLPTYRAIPRKTISVALESVNDAAVFFFDRVSSASIALAEKASAGTTLIMFEPQSASANPAFLRALNAAHIVKYARDRMSSIPWGHSMLLEVQTLGAKGLRFRRSRKGGWVSVPAVHPALLVDTCGAGDWCTAGLLNQLAAVGIPGVEQASTSKLRNALLVAQALAAWNCGFEGARGGMYETDRSKFARSVSALIAGDVRGTALAGNSVGGLKLNSACLCV